MQTISGRPPLKQYGVGVTSEFLVEVARGNIPGYDYIHKFGSNESVSTSIVPVCNGGFYRTPTGTATLEVISTSADDTAAGVGAREVSLQYLDSDFNLQTGTIATNGTSASTETISGVKRLVRAWVSSSGTYATQSSASQKGALTIRESGGGDTWATIPLAQPTFGVSQSLIGAYTVPAGKTAYILSFAFSSDVSGTKTTDFYFFKRENADDTTAPYSGTMRVQNLYLGTQGLHEFTHLTYEDYPEKTDIGFLAKATTATKCSVEFELLLIDN